MRFSLLVLLAAVLLLPSLASAGSKVSAADAYSEVIGWGMHISPKDVRASRTKITDVNERLERAAFRYGISLEFAMAVVATEGYMAPKVSHARSDSWAVYEKATQYKMSRYPEVMNDLDTALSTLAVCLGKSKKIDQALAMYWSGPGKSMNTDTTQQFVEYAIKIFNGLEPYEKERRSSAQQQRSGSMQPSDYSKYFDGYESWSNNAPTNVKPNKDEFSSKVGSRPMKISEMVYFEGHEEAYARQVKKFNKNLSDSEAKVIARSILNYCAKTGWSVDPRMVMAVVAAESRFRPNAVSRVGAMGLGQLMPATARGLGVSNAFDPVQNLFGCVKYIEREQHRWGKRPELIFAAYNAGPGAVKKYGGIPPYKETRNYVVTVKKYYNKFKS
jgi:hypothetical protein